MHKPGEGPPAHVHFKQEEILFIIEGLYEVTVGDEIAKAGPGSIIFIPRNAVHRFKNVGSITGRMLGWSLPGGQDHYLKAISELAAGGGDHAVSRSMYDESWYTGRGKYVPHIDFAIHAHDCGCGARTSRCSEIGRSTLRDFLSSGIGHSH